MKSFLTAASTVLLSLSSVSALSDHVKQNVRANLDGHRVVSINYNTLTNSVVDFLDSHQADHFGSDGDDVHFKLHPDAVKALEDQQISFDDFTDNWVDKMEARFNEPNFFCGDSTHECAKRDLQAFYSSYQTLAALHARLTDVAAASAGLATIGSIGTSYQGRDLKTIHIGDQTKPLVFYFCNIHAREWLTPMFCMYMAENLVANGGHALLEKFSFTILISANPDGYEYSWSTNNNWRKTRKPNSGSSCVGTDGNRNYPISRCGSGASTSPCSDTYCGAAALDQPETAAIAAYAAANADRLIATNDVHAYGQLWMCPWAYTTAVPPAADFQKMQQCNAAAAAGIEAIHGRQFDYGPVATTIYLAAGGSVDYFYASLGVIYAYTVEVRGTDFHPAASNILPSNEEIFGGMVASLECVADVEGISGTPTVPVPTDPPVATSSPTKFPTTGCADLVPSGLVYSGSGLPAECTDFGSFYCNNYAIVRERCPRTCGLCDAILTGLTMSVEAASDKLSKVSIMSPAALVTVYIVAPVGAAVFAAIIAVVVIKRRRAAAATEAAPTDVVV